jgi:alpha-L-rhamnosidase
VHDDCIALKVTKGPFALDDKLSQPVEQIHISACTFNAGYAALTCGSEATEVRDVIMEHCTVVGPMPLLHLKLRPDTPQSYHDIRVSDITMNSGTLFDVSPWKQFFDLKGQPAPQSSVKDVAISGVSGSFESFGRIVGNPGTVISNISLENVDVQLASEEFQHQAIDGLKVSNVQVNGTEFVAK